MSAAAPPRDARPAPAEGRGAASRGGYALDRLVVASNNAGKLREFERLLAPLGIATIAQSALSIDEAAEPHVTFVENAIAKARHASARSGLPALADDSGAVSYTHLTLPTKA